MVRLGMPQRRLSRRLVRILYAAILIIKLLFLFLFVLTYFCFRSFYAPGSCDQIFQLANWCTTIFTRKVQYMCCAKTPEKSADLF
jgi:hypothetical protein